MKLAEALLTTKQARQLTETYDVSLACGFTPLHLSTFISAHTQRFSPQRRVVISSGLYGDLDGTVQSWLSKQAAVGVVALEWQDLDLRLGLRHLGGWGLAALSGIVEEVASRLKKLAGQLASLPPSCRAVVVPPTLPLPPFFHTVSDQASEGELVLSSLLSDFLREISGVSNVKVVRSEKLAVTSPVERRYDFRSDLNTGFPYTVAHADAVAHAVAQLLLPPPAKKGLITDLDDTLWLGLVGEIGSDSVCWDQENHAQIHGLFQQMLQTLADQGTLLAVASKNNPEVAAAALGRTDIHIRENSFFPLEIHWDPKSHSVTRILKSWNIGADSVVFIDDNPLELAEVKAAHPDVECLLFPTSDYGAFWNLLNRLRDLFGKPLISNEDSYRLSSIREGAVFSDQTRSADQSEELLAGVQAEVVLDFKPDPADARLLELLNKTNQFNLNGERVSDSEWQRKLADPQRMTIAVHYKDKFGPLGKIAALQARRNGGVVEIESWVMSCRAFSRRIEHQTLSQLFAFSGATCVQVDFVQTPKNGPLQDFLTSLLDRPPQHGDQICKDAFLEKCPPLYHQVTKLHG